MKVTYEINLSKTDMSKNTRTFTTTEIKCMSFHTFLCCSRYKKLQFHLLEACLFHCDSSQCLTIWKCAFWFTKSPFWTKNNVSYQYCQSITNKSIDSFASNFDVIGWKRQCKVIPVEFFMHLGASSFNLRGRGQKSVKYHFL